MSDQRITTFLEIAKHVQNVRMFQRFTRGIGNQVLLGNIGNIICRLGFGIKMVEGLILFRTNVFGDRFVPFLSVGKFRIDIKDHPPERTDSGGVQPDPGCISQRDYVFASATTSLLGPV